MPEWREALERNFEKLLCELDKCDLVLASSKPEERIMRLQQSAIALTHIIHFINVSDPRGALAPSARARPLHYLLNGIREALIDTQPELFNKEANVKNGLAIVQGAIACAVEMMVAGGHHKEHSVQRVAELCQKYDVRTVKGRRIEPKEIKSWHENITRHLSETRRHKEQPRAVPRDAVRAFTVLQNQMLQSLKIISDTENWSREEVSEHHSADTIILLLGLCLARSAPDRRASPEMS